MSIENVDMSPAAARSLTTRIQLLVTTLSETAEKVVTLIEQAESVGAWRALGYANWTAYVTGEFVESLAGLDRAERLPISQKLSATGMSVRAVATITGTSVATAHADITTPGVHDPNTSTSPAVTSTVGNDGKSYPRPVLPAVLATVTTKDVKLPTPPPRKSRGRPLPDAYRDAVTDLERVVERLERLHNDDRFPAMARDKRPRLRGHRNRLERLVEQLAAMDRYEEETP